MLDNKPNQPSKFKTKNWVEINDESRGTYNKDNQIRFKTSMLRSNLCDRSNAYILVNETMHQSETLQLKVKQIIPPIKSCMPFTNCISRINNTQVEDAHDIHVVLPMYNLTEYSDNYSKVSGTLEQYCRDEMAVDDDTDITDFNVANSLTNLFKIK